MSHKVIYRRRKKCFTVEFALKTRDGKHNNIINSRLNSS